MDQFSIWISVCSTVVAIAAASYGVYRAWQDRRTERRELIHALARTAVRVTEAAYVRPLLKDRLRQRVNEFVHRHTDLRSTSIRALLFCDLQQIVGLTEVEKNTARVTAFNILVEQLRGIKPPPISIATDHELEQNTQRLQREVEIAYNLQPRPANTMILDLAHFLNGLTSLNS